MESSKEKRMVISLILFRCTKHSILPRKTGTWEKRVPSSYGQNSIAQSHKMQYLQPFFFLYHSLLIIQHKILFQWLSGFDNKQQISDFCWKEKGIPHSHQLWIQDSQKKETLPYPICSVVAVFKMLVRILNTLRSRIWDILFFLFSSIPNLQINHWQIKICFFSLIAFKTHPLM